MENTIRFIINADGTHKVSNRGILRALSQYDTKLYIITPLPLETSIRVNYLIHERHDIRTQQYLTPVVNMKGCDLVSELESIYQEVADWNVFGCSINPLAYSKISKYRSGRIGISFTISQVLNVEGNPNLTNYKGLIGSNGDIPSGTYQNGDYFECDTFNFFSQTLNKRLTQGSIAYFKDNAWHELERFEVIKNTTTENVAVDPACLAETPPATEETINEIIANYTGAVAETVDKVNYLEQKVEEIRYRSYYEFDNINDFPATGSDKALYLAKKTNTALEGDEDNWEDYNMLFRFDVETEAYIPITNLIKIDDTTIIRNNNDELEVATAILDDIESRVSKNEFETFKIDNNHKINAVENGLQIQIDEMEFVVDITLVGNDIKVEHRDGDITYIPVNEAVENGYYDTNTKELVLELANGNEVRILSGDIVAGLASVDYVDTGLALKENKSNKITELVGVPNNTQYMSAKLTNDLIMAARTEFNSILDNKVDKIEGKGLSTEDYTTNEKNKLFGIASGAEVNVQSDWNATSGDALILNKPAIPNKVSDLTNDTGYITGYTETDPIFTAWDKSTGINITKSQVSDFSHTHNDLYYNKDYIDNLDLSGVEYKGAWVNGSNYKKGDIVYSNENDDTKGFVYLFHTDKNNSTLLPETIDGYCINLNAFTNKAKRIKLPDYSGGATTKGALVATHPSSTYYGDGDQEHRKTFYLDDIYWLKDANGNFHLYDSRGKLASISELFSGSYNDLTNKPTIPTKTSDLTNDSGFATETWINQKVSSVYKYKGSVATYSNLPTTGLTIGDVYDIQSNGMNYAWTGTSWDALGMTIDLSNYYNKTDVDSMLDEKQDKLVAGDNITIDPTTNVISASGGGGEVDPNAMAYFDYAGSIYHHKYSLLANAWEHSLTVDPSEISEDSSQSSPRGIAQYPNGETEGVIIPDSVTTIGKYTFYNWTANNQPLVIPNSVTSIDLYAFHNWTSNNQPLVIPNSVTSIGPGAFQYWSSNNQPLTIPSSVASIGSNAFHNWSVNNHPLTISNSVTSISNGAFGYWSSNNQPLVIPDSVTSIEAGAFQYWTSNNQPLVIPNSVTSIGNYAFRSWSSNNQPLIIPNSMTSIGQYAFERWSLVPYIEMQAITPPTLVNADAFYNQNNAPIYVPDESVEVYKTAAQWDMLAYRIFPISDKPDLMDDIADLQENKLNKIWTDVAEQATTNLTDVLVFNRGSNVYKTKVSNLLAQVDNEIFKVVSVLPTTGGANKIYLVPSGDPKTQNELDEYIWVNNTWEKIGSVSVDLSNYFNKTEINSMLGGKQDKLVAGNNITIDPDTNVISATGGSGGGEVDPNAMAYFDYAGSIYHHKYSLLANAWEHSLTVDPSEISEESSQSSPRGTAQYPNGETEGVIIPQGVTSIGNYAFDGWSSNNQPLVIPNSVTSIGERAFFYWTSNNQPLVIPDSVTSIDRNAFYYWKTNNQPLVIPNSVTSIGDGAFSEWRANNHPLVIPNSVTSIGIYAFYGWSLVPYVEIKAITPPTLASRDAFDGQNNAPIYVPDESVDTYKTATNWVSLASRIFPISDKPDLMDDIADLQENKQDKLVAGDNITIDPTTNVISASGGDAYTKEEIDTMIGDIENALDAILGV